MQDAIADVPGVVAMATTATETLYAGAAGVRARGAAAPMTLDTVFHLASMTKAVTSVAAMQLVEQDRLSLDAPIGDVLPELASPKVLTGYGADGAPLLRAAAGPVTLRQLLTHSAGYGYDTWNAEIKQWNAVHGGPRLPTNWEQLRAAPLLFDPGTRWNYGINTDVVGKAVEAVSLLPLDQYWRAHVTGPLGMIDTGVTMTAEQRTRRALVHARAADGSLSPMDMARGEGPSFCMGGGMLCGTAPDYLRFVRMLLARGGDILRPETVASMARNQMGGLAMLPMRSAVAERSNDVEFFPGMRKEWGLGFMINTERAPSGRSAGSLAWAGLANTYYWIDPARGVGGVVMMQVLPFADARCLEVLSAFETSVYGLLD